MLRLVAYVYVYTGSRPGSSRHRRRGGRTGTARSGTGPSTACAAIRDEIAPAVLAAAAAPTVVGGGGELLQVAGRASRVVAVEKPLRGGQLLAQLLELRGCVRGGKEALRTEHTPPYYLLSSVLLTTFAPPYY